MNLLFLFTSSTSIFANLSLFYNTELLTNQPVNEIMYVVLESCNLFDGQA